MIRRNIRLRREYLYKKSIESKVNAIKDKKDRLKRCLENNHPLDTDLKSEALNLEKSIEWENENSQANDIDDEYRFAGLEAPKIMITTSRNPSSKLKQFTKELKLLFPNSQRMNRGHYEIKMLLESCKENKVTDFIIVHEHRGQPVNLQVCHLPFGPTAFFTLTNVVTRHDIPHDEIGAMSQAYPNLIFHNFTTNLGKRVTKILQHLFPVPNRDDSKRIITFYNQSDIISFRHHMYKMEEGHIKLTEIGPRFEMKLYEIKLGTLDTLAISESEWSLKPYMNTANKRFFLSNE